jgi:CBS domain containing-hemolysin-like protein
MMLFMVLVCTIVFLLLVAVSGFVPKRSTMSTYELERRKSYGDKTAVKILDRERLLGDILSLQRAVSALLLVILVTLLVATFGWLGGTALALLVALEYGSVARLGLFQRRSQKFYENYEERLLVLAAKHGRGFLRLVRNVTPVPAVDAQLASREELQHLVAQSRSLLSEDEKKLIAHGLEFNSREVNEIMTPRGVIDSISKRELLGPLVLDDLHKTGHSRFPVTDGDIDHVVGMLHIQDLFTLDAKRSVTAEKAMEPRVFYIREDQTLDHALAAFLRTHHHLFIVVNEFRETVGILSLEDVIETLLGRKIIDEFDTHEDLRLVAMRNPRGNNHPLKSEDV